MSRARLPVGSADVQVQLPTGAEDILLLESGAPDFAVALALLSRVVHRTDGAAIDWSSVAVTDVDVLLLHLRRRVLGDCVTAEVTCAAEACRARVDITFSIDEYLGHHRPRKATGAVPSSDAGWFRLDGSEIEFRVPRAIDQIAIALEPRPEDALLARCVRPPQISSRARRRVEAAMEAMAPSLFSELQGSCPECGALVRCDFDPLQYILRELRDQAAFVYEEVAAIARYTHWSEVEILSLPAARRTRYAELAPHDEAN